MDLQEELLMFLYNNKSSLDYVQINDVLQKYNVSNNNKRRLLEDLQIQQIINLKGELSYIDGQIHDVLRTFENTPISAHLTPVIGEKYVKDKYLQNIEKKEVPIIQIGGDNYGHIAHAQENSSVHQESIITQNTNNSKSKDNSIISFLLKHIWKIISGIIIIVAAALILSSLNIK